MAKHVSPNKSGTKPKSTPKPNRRTTKQKQRARSIGAVDCFNYDIFVRPTSGDLIHVSKHKKFKQAAAKWRKLLGSCAAIDQVRLASRRTGIHIERCGRLRGAY